MVITNSYLGFIIKMNQSLEKSESSMGESQKSQQARSSSPEMRDSKVTPSVGGSMSTEAASKLSNEGPLGESQLRGAKIISLKLRNYRFRSLAMGFGSVSVISNQIKFFDNEKCNMIKQINKLSNDKSKLLEENPLLKNQNEHLIDNLKKTFMKIQNLSLDLDQMRPAKMVRVISKLIKLQKLEALIMIKNHPESN